jgi:hypothetical protein
MQLSPVEFEPQLLGLPKMAKKWADIQAEKLGKLNLSRRLEATGDLVMVVSLCLRRRVDLEVGKHFQVFLVTMCLLIIA